MPSACRCCATLRGHLQVAGRRRRTRRNPIDAGVIGAVLSRQLDDLEPQLTRNGYDVRSLVEQFDAKPAEIRQLLRGDLDPARSQELLDQMRAAGLPT